jgi:hypothetical protein
MMKRVVFILFLMLGLYGCDVTYVPDGVYDNRPYYSPYINPVHPYPYYYYPYYYQYYTRPYIYTHPYHPPHYTPTPRPNIHYGPRGPRR